MIDERFERFFQGYVDCALWSSTDNSDPETGGESMQDNYGPDDIAGNTLAQMRADCVNFWENSRWLPDYEDEPEQAGHDFWLTRNRHGVGFWDRGLGALGERLSEEAHAYGSYDLYVGDDGLVYGT